MATSGSSTFELTAQQLVRRACQLAGVTESSQTPDGDDYAMAYDFLGMELTALQAEGIVLMTMERATLALLAGTFEYQLPADTLDVFVGPDMIAGTFAAPGDYETPVRVMARHEYVAQVPNKALTSARPSAVYIERHAQVKLVFWPVPSVAGTFRYERQRLPFDARAGNTLDLARKWQKAICFGVAWQVAVAKSAPAAQIKILKETAEGEKATARAQDVEHLNQQFYVRGLRF